VLAQPAAKALAEPTTVSENMELIQNWLATKLAREKPTRKRTTMNSPGVEAMEVMRMMGAVMTERIPDALRGPTRSQIGPIRRRERMEPAKEAEPAVPMSAAVRLRSWRMMGRRGGIAKVVKKHEKRLNQDR
jgi:hypothetical protein